MTARQKKASNPKKAAPMTLAARTAERRMILGNGDKRPYATKTTIHVQTDAALGSIGEGAGLAVDDGTMVVVTPTRKSSWEGGIKYAARADGYATASAAETAGRRLAESLLWSAICFDFPMRLDYRTHEPAVVVDRRNQGGSSMWAEGQVGRRFSTVAEEMNAVLARNVEPDPRLLLSMEIFASAELEASPRARFLSIVSAFEPLADAQKLPKEVAAFVRKALRLASSLPPSARTSMTGRVRALAKESISQAIRRVIDDAFPGRKDIRDEVVRAYSIRSALVHDGKTDPDVDLEHRARRISPILRELYAQRIGRQLLSPSLIETIYPPRSARPRAAKA